MSITLTDALTTTQSRMWAAAVRAYVEVGFDGYMRVDHVPTMAGETNDLPGYETLGRLFAIGYARGLIEATEKE